MNANAKRPLLMVPCCLCFLVFGLWVRLAAGQTKETPATDGNVKTQVSVNAVLRQRTKSKVERRRSHFPSKGA
jgi:hypothetical protein